MAVIEIIIVSIFTEITLISLNVYQSNIFEIVKLIHCYSICSNQYIFLITENVIENKANNICNWRIFKIISSHFHFSFLVVIWYWNIEKTVSDFFGIRLYKVESIVAISKSYWKTWISNVRFKSILKIINDS